MTVTATVSNVLSSSQTGLRIGDYRPPRTTERSKPQSTIGARASATVRLRPQWVWHRLSDPCNWPALLEHLTSIVRSDSDMDEYIWSVLDFTSPIRLTVREPPLHLAWQSVIGAEPRLSGEIILEPLGWDTRLTVQLNYVTAEPRLLLLLQTLELQLQSDVSCMAQVLETRIAHVPERATCEPS